ncbi:MAG: ATP-binding protein [Armatimonadota bacterium]|nr:ATP-binding protein [Armatimonadota bacterium]
MDQDNVIVVDKNLALLRSLVIYGANASGKSNLLTALDFMRRFVGDSAREAQAEDPIPVEPFCLHPDTVHQPSVFETVFLLDGIQYRYGFSVTSERVVAEWLYYVPTRQEIELFTRDEKGIYVRPRFEDGHGLEKRTRKNALFLSVVAQFNGEQANHIRDWFITQCRSLTTIQDYSYFSYTVDCIAKERFDRGIEEFVRRLDLDISALSVIEAPIPRRDSAPPDPKMPGFEEDSTVPTPPSQGRRPQRHVQELRTHHAIRDDQGMVVGEEHFSARTMESEGSQKIIALAGPLLDVLTNGWTLFIDEIDARLHPLITVAILRLFNSQETNPKNAQLICATHDTNLLDHRRLRRDQIYFVEKDKTAATRLYSLAEFKLESSEGALRSIRNDTSLERNYIQGRFGAIPYIGDINQFFAEEVQRQVSGPDGVAAEQPI